MPEMIRLRFGDKRIRKVPKIDPMRPKSMGPKVPTKGWIGQRKRDGSLTLLYKVNGTVAYANRRGVDKTHLYPELVDDEPKAIKARSAIIQGETFTGEGKLSDFEDFLRRDLIQDPKEATDRAQKYPLKFEALDIIRLNGQRLDNLPLNRRQEILAGVIPEGTKELSIAKSYPDTEKFLQQMRKEKGVEGVVFKDLYSTYRSGKQGAWRKLKFKKEADVVITGYVPGKGKRKEIGTLKMSVWHKGKLMPVGEVGTGFTDDELRRIKKRIDRGDRLFAKIAYMRVGAQGKLYAPSFKSLRSDITVEETHL